MKPLVSWVEIPANDFSRAVDFYQKILDVQFEVMEGEDEKMAFFPSGDGSISQAPDFKPCKDGVLVSLNAGTDLDGTLDRILEQGGSVIQAKTKIQAENRGYFALFMDSEGNRVGLYGD
jgi:predicted enzyme related to lactoylglutathione lyase